MYSGTPIIQMSLGPKQYFLNSKVFSVHGKNITITVISLTIDQLVNLRPEKQAISSLPGILKAQWTVCYQQNLAECS